MLEILKFIFSSFWIWLGMVILLGIIVEGIVDLATIILNRKTLDK